MGWTGVGNNLSYCFYIKINIMELNAKSAWKESAWIFSTAHRVLVFMHCSPLIVFLSFQMSFLSAFNSMTHLHFDVDVLQGSFHLWLSFYTIFSEWSHLPWFQQPEIYHPNQSAYISNCYSLAMSSRHRDVLQETHTPSQALLLFLNSPSDWMNPLFTQSQNLVITPESFHLLSLPYIYN